MQTPREVGKGWVWWCTLAIPALGTLKQEDPWASLAN